MLLNGRTHNASPDLVISPTKMVYVTILRSRIFSRNPDNAVAGDSARDCHEAMLGMPGRSQFVWRYLLCSFDETVAFVEELQHGFAAFEVCPVGGEFDAIAGTEYGHIEHFADAGRRAIGHHHDAIG
ncbi:hypothetical protein EV291_105147 [Rhizobium sp. BK068]|nr:hypothetical protein EV291_105147 [Rhizobium sp. BK068]